jgi:2-phosphosulfolactate phosphatase
MLQRMIRRLDVAMLPSEALAIETDCFVVVDLLRATTTAATLFAAGLDNLLVVDDVDRAREAARQSGELLFGEVGGLPPEGFDHGNSPIEAAAASVAGKGAVLFTTNGTLALCSLAPRGAVLAGALVNAGAVASVAAGYDRVVVVCAGESRGLRFAQEDFLAAGVIARRLTALAPEVGVGDAAALAIRTASGPDLQHLVRASHHARTLAALGLAADIDFALCEDTSLAVPAVVASGAGWALLQDARSG